MKPVAALAIALTVLTAAQASAFVTMDLFPPTIDVPPVQTPGTPKPDN
ncbi:hypothetical protein [Actibacterium ureilyticum]|nr:hypothetical protein [Actibacterium ureilyticum]